MRINVDRAIRQIRQMPIPAGLQVETLRRLPTVDRRSFANRKVFLAIAVCAFAAILAISYPRIAVARDLNSIAEAIKDRIVHLTSFDVEASTKIPIMEMWTDGIRVRSIQDGVIEVHDGKRFVQLRMADRIAKTGSAEGAFAHKPTGFTLDDILSDMRVITNLSRVELDQLADDGKPALRVRFRTNGASFTMWCENNSRLPYRFEIDERGKRIVTHVDYPTSVDPQLFVVTVPKGFKVYNVDKGLAAFAVEPVYETEENRAKLRIYDFSINEKGDLFLFMASNHFENAILAGKPGYLGPRRSEVIPPRQFRTMDPTQVDGLNAHVLAWASSDPIGKGEPVRLSVDLMGAKSVDVALIPSPMHGTPDYFDFAENTRTYMKSFDVTLDELRTLSTPRHHMDDFSDGGVTLTSLVLDRNEGALRGIAENTSPKPLKDAVVSVDLYTVDSWTGNWFVRLGDLAPGARRSFEQDFANSTFPLAKVVVRGVSEGLPLVNGRVVVTPPGIGG